jgi:predicted transposase/invertase (TIGR01784 family)
MNFADPRSDIAFKKIFGSQQRSHILISFLNAALGFGGERAIASLTILNPYQAPDLKGLKESILDVKATDKLGREFIVEMQIERDPFFCKRAVYYSAKAYSQQLDKGLYYDTLHEVYFLGILSFNVFDNDKPLSRHLILNEETRQQDIKELEFNFIELPKFLKTEAQLDNIVDKWLFFLKHAVEFETVPKALASEPAIREALEIADQHNWSRNEIDAYEHWSMRERASLLNREALQREVDQAKADADAAKADADAAKADADAAKADADAAKADADAAKALAAQAELRVEAEAHARQRAEGELALERQKAETQLAQALAKMIQSGMPEAQARQWLGLP